MAMLRPMAVASTLRTNAARRCHGRLNLASYFSSSAYVSSESDEAEELEFLVRLDSARLGFPGGASLTQPLDLRVQPASTGGHAVLGRNGSGKSLLANTLADGSVFSDRDIDAHLHEGTIVRGDKWSPRSVSRVSFESHESLLAQGGTVYSALTPLGGQLSKAAQFLIVRFGLFPFLNRPVNTLSTGEIRKVLLVRALSTRPDLLILDNAFDGLDVPSRTSLSDLVSKTLRGFRPDILVTGVNAKDTAHTQVVLITQRAEEIVDEVTTVSLLRDGGNQLLTEKRGGRTGAQLMRAALDSDGNHDEQDSVWEQNDFLPTEDEISAMWQSGGKRASPNNAAPLVEATDVRVSVGDATLLNGLDWAVNSGERWLVAGGNGAGKSTLSRLLAKEDERMKRVSSGMLRMNAQGVGWVSTELHMSQARSTRTAQQVLLGVDETEEVAGVGDAVASWLGLDATVLSKPFRELSQGEQKLVLIGSALAKRPSLLILDEPLQGLDLVHRGRVLGLVERVCRATNMSLVYITHHMEELLPSITHVLHLKDGKAAFKGSRYTYDPDVV